MSSIGKGKFSQRLQQITKYMNWHTEKLGVEIKKTGKGRLDKSKRLFPLPCHKQACKNIYHFPISLCYLMNSYVRFFWEFFTVL